MRLIVQAADIQQSVPSALSLKEALENPRLTSASSITNDNARDQTLKRITLQTRWRFNDSTLFEGAIWGWDKSLYHPIFQVVDQESQTRGAFGRSPAPTAVPQRRRPAPWPADGRSRSCRRDSRAH